MPPKRDTLLETRILVAAQKLWRRRGAAGLTIRDVARAAGTTTPTVYQRFKDKKALQVALAQRLKAELNAELFAAPSIEEVFHRYVQFAEAHPHEYDLLWRTWSDVFHPRGPRPLRSWLLTQFAARFGGKPKNYSQLFYSFLLLAHGAATMLTIPADDIAHNEVRRNFRFISAALMKNVKVLREK